MYHPFAEYYNSFFTMDVSLPAVAKSAISKVRKGDPAESSMLTGCWGCDEVPREFEW